MERPLPRYGSLAAGLAVAAAVLSAGGCRTLLFTPLYLLRGTNIAAQYDGLKEKRVAVVCRPVASLTYRDSRAAGDLARQIGALLRENVPKIEVIDQQKVADWTDANTWDEYPEVADALEADVVVGVELQHFTIYQGQTLYQGKATVGLRVYDCADGARLVFDKELPQSVYPPNTGIPTSERLEAEFRREFVRVLAEQIARHFYPHDPHADYALDAKALD